MQRHASVVIFGGTSEGRELAEYAEARHIPVLVSVVSGYGESLLRESDLVQVHTGALDEAAMRQFLLEAAPKLVLDATHPYARVVTEQVAALCRELAISYQRILRGSETEKAAGQNSGMQEDRQDLAPVFVVDSVSEAAACLKQDGRPVLLTTGSKELEAFAGIRFCGNASLHGSFRTVRSLKNVRILAFTAPTSLPCRDRFRWN